MRLDELRETRSPQPLELLRRERGPQRDVGQQRERRVDSRDRGVQRDTDTMLLRRSRDIGAEEIDGVGQCQRPARPGSLVQHGRRHARETGLVGGVHRAPGLHHEVHLHERHLMLHEHQHRQAVRQGVSRNRRQGERLDRSERRRLGTVDLLGKPGHGETQGKPCSQCCAALQRGGPPGTGLGLRFHVALLLAGTARSVFPCGTTLNTTRAAGFREVMTADWTSDESIAR